MADRTITTRLTLDPSQYESAMQRAKKATEGLGESSKRTEKATTSAMQRMAQSARDNRAEWQQVGGTLAGVGAATSALMGVVLATGIGYNDLRQRSHAALTTLTGSAQDAVAQMDKLDDFASNSPFARDVFIRAQQQMLGFGIEASKVIPYLDSIQNAVAAAGGSNHDIAELSRIFSQISASAKITATDLREFGNRGIDAATLIGSQMGVTGAEIRDQITDGTLDAGEALDALAAGMATTFDGAAAGVKETFAGAVDRVKAAFRDLSSIVAEPLVGREGGGLFTGLLNQVADFLRMVEDLPAPIVQIGGALTGLGGLATLAAGGFMVLAPRIVETIDAARRLGFDVSALENTFRRLSPHIGTAMVAIGQFGAAAAAATTGVLIAKHVADAIAGFDDAAPAVENLTNRLRSLSDELSGYDAILGDMDLAGFTTLEQAVDKLTNMSSFDKFLHNMGIAADRSHVAAEGLEQAGVALAGMAQTDMAAAAQAFSDLAMEAGGTDQAAINLLNTMPAFRDQMESVALEMGLATDDASLLKIALGYIGPEAEAASEAVGDYAGILGGFQTAQQEANDRLQEWREMVAESPAALGGLLNAYQAVIDKNREVAESTAESTDSSEDSWEDFYDGVSVSAEDWISSLEEQAEAVRNFRANALEATEQIREQVPADMQAAADAMVDEMLRGGEEGAAALSTFTDMSQEEKLRLIEAWMGTGTQIGNDFATELESARQPEIGASTVPAEDALAALLGAVAEAEESVILNGYSVPAEGVLSDLRHKIATSEEPVTINGNEAPANDVLNALMRAIANEEEDVTINGNRVPADQVTGELLAWIARQERSVDVGANIAGAQNTVNNWQPPNKTIAFGADLSAARREVLSWSPAVQVRLMGQAAVATGAYMGDFPKFHSGGSPRRAHGLLEGPGTTTSDSILARLSRKEFVVNAAATDYYSPAFMYALNSRRIPKETLPGFRDGGSPRHMSQVQYVTAPRAAGTQRVSLEGMTVAVRVGERQFTGYVEGVADGRIAEDRRSERMWP